MSQFSLKQMLVAVGVIALSMWLQRQFDSSKQICFICGAAVGATVFSLVGRPLFGAVAGVGAQVVILIVLEVVFHVRMR